MAQAHHHDFLGASHERNERRTRWVVLLSAIMMVAEISLGTVTGSMALVADGWHMATHTLALGIAAWAYWLARRWSTDPRYSFGTGKLGSLAGFASALGLAAVALGIAWESIGRLRAPQDVQFGEALVVAVIGLAVNLASAALLGHGHDQGHHDHDHDHGHDHHHHDHNLRSAYLHVLSDALTSVLAILALAAGWWLGVRWLDPAVGLVGALVILVWSRGLIRDTAAVLLDRVPDQALCDGVRQRIEAPGDAAIHDFHIWQVGPGRYAAIVAVAGPVTPGEVRRRIGPDPRFAHVTVEVG
ncbi:CDF family Co(II)/Ni(II) efflux transporter DmeF [Sphingomonas sp. BN140010]|uniref:CDF family Co(II)/Ni(II) efflux transporter DmeF n=1 Tax=Sphingomonas arvum TaxID=2992113 RepID=A0ABT3JG58_9SPHN|nr:CDF family Co(II)/Ni(II) efflux transporter DmeF [Sphingomonas sp. BN140010]MCW3798050.1 CDF family Co(II)/Ni(II) efflux transporter DmeF [Sphingomonas sp. BN140010]